MQKFATQPKLFDRLGGRSKLELFLKNFYATMQSGCVGVGRFRYQDGNCELYRLSL